MALLSNNKRHLREQSARRRRRGNTQSKTSHFFETNQIISSGLFLLLAALIVIICFLGQSAPGPQVMVNQEARFAAITEFPFSYESRLLTQRQREQVRMQVAPVFRLDDRPFQEFRSKIDDLLAGTPALREELDDVSPGERSRILEQFSKDFHNRTGLNLAAEDLNLILQQSSEQNLQNLFAEGLIILREIHREGIARDPTLTASASGGDRRFLPSIEILGRAPDMDIKDEIEALRFLNLNMRALDADPTVLSAISRILKIGLTPNLAYDEEESKRRLNEALASIEPIVINVPSGRAIFEPGMVVTAEQMEQYAAYRNELRQRQDYGFGFTSATGLQVVYTLGILLSTIVYLRLVLPTLLESNRRLCLTALILLVNLGVIRLLLYLSDTALVSTHSDLVTLLPVAAPVALGAIILTIMIGPHPAVVLSFLISIFNSLMQGNALDIFFASFLSCLTAIYFCRDVRLRGKVVRAGAMGGGALALFLCFFGLLTDTSLPLIAQQMFVAFIAGVITSTVALGLLPLLENLFKFTTDITLLELTDFNHPLLRKMQMVAPGTYHHSLMVANLAERAAVEIGANPLLCRTTSLFHDIGKMVKPEYFIENQGGGFNPHSEKSPSMSALVIKAHVKEGVEMGRDYKLPSIVIDVIRQHHGTSIIAYFYNKALQQSAQTTLPLAVGHSNAGLQNDTVDESTFRYDGPRPRFKESGIILLADCIEAASRSLKKVTPQSVEELVDGIIKDRIEDRQLDECPLTIQELNRIRKSFSFTLLNMLHNRVEYPRREKPANGPVEPPAKVTVQAQNPKDGADKDNSAHTQPPFTHQHSA